jgi:hypothetical protein
MSNHRGTGADSADAAQEVAADLSARDLRNVQDVNDWTDAENALWIALPWFASGMFGGVHPNEDEYRPTDTDLRAKRVAIQAQADMSLLADSVEDLESMYRQDKTVQDWQTNDGEASRC